MSSCDSFLCEYFCFIIFNLYDSLIIIIIICLHPCRWSLKSLLTGNKVKTHKPRYCEKEKYNAEASLLPILIKLVSKVNCLATKDNNKFWTVESGISQTFRLFFGGAYIDIYMYIFL